MGKRKVKAEVKRAALARIQAGSSSFGEEAERTGLSKSTLHEALDQVKPDAGNPGPGPSPQDTPLQAADKAIGAAPPGPKTPLTKEELFRAGPDMVAQQELYCLTTINQLKALAVFGGGMVMGIPVLTDEKLPKLRALNPMAVDAVKIAAPELEPLMRKWFPDGSTLIGLAFALIIDAGMTFMAMREISGEYREKREAEKKKADAAKASAPQAAAA